MKSYVLDIIPKISRYSDERDLETYIFNKAWVLVDEDSKLKIVYRFRPKNDEIIISVDGNAKRGTWEFLEDGKSMIIEVENETKIFKHGFIDDTILALKLDNDESEYVVFFNDDKHHKIKDNSLNTIKDYLKVKYEGGLAKKVMHHDVFSKTFPLNWNQPIIKADSFSIEYYPELKGELELLNDKLQHLITKKFTADIILAFSEKRTISGELSKFNTQLLELLKDQKLPIALIDKIFAEHKFKTTFLNDFREYLRSNIVGDNK